MTSKPPAKARQIPTSRVGRIARLAALSMSGGDARVRRTAEVLGTLRGLAAKVGQMASYVDGLVPEEHRDVYESSLCALRAHAAHSDTAAVRHLIEEELGAPIDQLFAEWNDTPFASASIGQVHRARLHDGHEIAVKVQHPEIAKAIESDLANAGLVEAMIGALGGRRLDSKGLFEVAKTRFREELDYRHEAQSLLFFARLHAHDAKILVPGFIPSHSSARVLSTELALGATFETACGAPEADRRAWAETLWRYVYRGSLVGGRFNADPHPGNYVFLENGTIVFLDYGCVQAFAGDALSNARKMHQAALLRDEAAFAKRVSVMVKARSGRLENAARSYVRRCFEPLFESPFRVTRPYAGSLVTSLKDLALLARSAKDDELFTMPPEMLFINRLQFGFYSVLARLDVNVDYAAVERSFAAEIPGGG